MEKQLGWTHRLGGAEPLGISKGCQSVLARLRESLKRHQLAISERGGWGELLNPCGKTVQQY